MPMPAVPGADFVICPADLLFGHLEAFPDGPASTGDLREGGEGGPVRAVDDVIGEIRRILATAPDQQPVFPGRLLQPGQAEASPVVEPISFAAGPRREASPGSGRQTGGQA